MAPASLKRAKASSTCCCETMCPAESPLLRRRRAQNAGWAKESIQWGSAGARTSQPNQAWDLGKSALSCGGLWSNLKHLSFRQASCVDERMWCTSASCKTQGSISTRFFVPHVCGSGQGLPRKSIKQQRSSADEGASHLLKGWRRNTNMERTGPCCEIADQNLPLGPRISRPRAGERAAKEGKRCEVEGSVDFAIYFFEFWISTILYPNYPNFVNLGEVPHSEVQVTRSS